MIVIKCCNFGSWFSDSLIVRDWFCRENDLIRPPQRRNEPLGSRRETGTRVHAEKEGYSV